MSIRRFSGGIAVLLSGLLASCSGGSGPDFISTDAPWRARTEQACLRTHAVDRLPYVSVRRSLGGPKVCGAIRPYLVSAALGGRIELKPAATLRCPMIPALDQWLYRIVQPAARRYFGAPVVRLQIAASYACRPRNSKPGAKLSEHGFANAIDISAFHLAGGRKVTVLRGWRKGGRETAFLREIHGRACGIFKTVLGPKADRHHQDHFHLDLARHGRSGKAYCR